MAQRSGTKPATQHPDPQSVASLRRTPCAVDPTKYNLHVVSFSVVREPGYDAHHRGSGGKRPKLDSPETVAALARQLIEDDAKEHFWVLLLNAQNRLVAAHHVSTSTLRG